MRYWISGYYKLTKRYFKTNSSAQFYANEKYHIELIGHIGYQGSNIKLEQIAELFFKEGVEIIRRFTGLFILLIFNKITHELFVFHDKTTSYLPFYYIYQDNTIYFSTSLKYLLSKLKTRRTLNLSATLQLVRNGIIHNRNTLIEGIYKLELFHFLFVTYKGVTQKAITYLDENVLTESEAMSLWNIEMPKAILKGLSKGNNEVSIALSSGYDSNYILHTLNNECRGINAFTIGGNKSINETPTVRRIVTQYENVKLFEKIIDWHDLCDYPEIVWRLEGNLVECGIILQYALAKLAATNHIKYLICGECADEIMNKKYFDITLPIYELDKKKSKDFSFTDNPFYMTNLLITKKSGILLNSFGIEPYYPYKDDTILMLAKSLKRANGLTKEFHKSNCLCTIPPRITQYISNIGGATDFIDLIHEAKFCQLKTYVQRSNIISFFNPDINFEQMSYTTDAVDMLFRHLYIILFYELFISGKYDTQFKNECVVYDEDDFFELIYK